MSGFGHFINNVFATNDPKIDGILGGSSWGGSAITYYFATSASIYSSNYSAGEQAGFFATNAAQQSVIRSALDTDDGNPANDGFAFEGFTAMSVSQTFSTGAHIRANQTTLDPYGYTTAWGFFPGFSENAGDLWLSSSNYDYSAPSPGNYPYTLILHEVGHTLGLEHGHQATTYGTLPSNWDSMEYTIMTYRSYEDGPFQYRNETTGFAQSFMMLDIAALQLMYGANYTVNSGDTVYSWDPASGVTMVNGAAAITPINNRIFATVWDGGGIDTYDLSAYSNDLAIDLAPGGFSLFSAFQQAALGDGHFAQGNIYNALTINNDLRSLIENAIGGSGNDTITGNQTGNILKGGGGDDVLNGGGWHDTVLGQAGRDRVKGGAGHDIVNGGGGNDRVFGNAGVDKVIGGKGNDRLFGNGGRDELIGGDGNDRMNGGGAKDTLLGGKGADIMTGGAARDTFIWTKANQSGVKGAAIDQITDFTHRTDKLDFSDLTQAAIKLHIKGAFTGTGPSIITKEIAGTTRVLVDSDGDGSANMRIDLLDTLGVTATDFIL